MAEQGGDGRNNRRRRTLTLSELSPNQIESVAKWIESVAAKYPMLIAQGKAWLKQHPEDVSQQKQNAYWEAYMSTCKQLAYLARREIARMAKLGEKEG